MSTIACVIQYISVINYAIYTSKPQINYICWCRKFSNLRFADDIDLIAGRNAELQELTNILVEASKEYGMEVSKEKSKTMVNNENENASISMDGTLLEDVNPFKYLGATLKSDGTSDNELRIQ